MALLLRGVHHWPLMVSGLGVGAQGLGFGVQGLGFGAQGLRFRVQGGLGLGGRGGLGFGVSQFQRV